MLNENAKKWVAALRSGEYQQTTGRLRKDGGYCCMGVLCDVYAKEGLGQWGDTFTDSFCVAPADVYMWAGLRGGEGAFGQDREYNCLTCQNDQLGKSFSEIADIIESEPKGMFV